MNKPEARGPEARNYLILLYFLNYCNKKRKIVEKSLKKL